MGIFVTWTTNADAEDAYRIMMGTNSGPGREYAVQGLEVLAEANGAVLLRASGMRRVGVAAFKVCDLLGVSLSVHSHHVVSVGTIESRNGSKPGRPVTCATPLGLSPTTSDLIATGTH